MLKKTLSIISFLFITAISYSQDNIIRLNNIIGKCELYNNMTIDEAEQNALLDAKKNAIEKSGILETLNISKLLSTSNEDNGVISQYYSEIAVSETAGLIDVVNKKMNIIHDSINNRIYVNVTIDADIHKENKKDNEFILSIDDIDEAYKNGEKLKFKVTSYGSPSYIKVFWLSKNNGDIIFPNQKEKNFKLDREKEYLFPINKSIDYIANKEDMNNEYEKAQLIIVATKENIPYIKNTVNYENIMQWYLNIPQNKRTLSIYNTRIF